MNSNVVAVVVTFNSDLSRLNESLIILSKQCNIVVVDNSDQIDSQDQIRLACERIGISLLPLWDNKGIAHAQNIGIAWAKKQGICDILLMDDDTIPPENFVADLLEARTLSKVQPAVVGARIIDTSGNDLSNCKHFNLEKLNSCENLNSSGTIIPVKVFDRVGLFDEQLFIDCVDFEWGWRAIALDVPIMICGSVMVVHRLGEGTRCGLRMPSPIRHYYQYRNVLRMIFSSKASFFWRLTQIFKLPIKLLLITLIADSRLKRLSYAAWGIFDFICGRKGKFNH